MSTYPGVSIASIVINTEDGELTLFGGSETGIKKILRKDGYYHIYFGALVPSYETGKIYWAQGLAQETPPEIWYGTLSGLSDVEDVSSLDGLTRIASGAVSVSTRPGDMTVVLVPAGYHAAKDDGFGSKAPFAEDNGAAGTGANGTPVTIGGVRYKLYGEFNLVTGTTIIYINEE